MNEGYCEYCVKKDKKGAQGLLKVLYGAFFIITPVLILFLLFLFTSAEILSVGFPLVVCVFFGTFLLTKKYLTIEYEYTIVGGEMDADIIYGGASRKALVNVILKNVNTLAPYDERFGNLLDEGEFEKIYNITSGKKDVKTYFIIFDENGKKYAVLFEADEKALAMLKTNCISALKTRDM